MIIQKKIKNTILNECKSEIEKFENIDYKFKSEDVII